MFNRLIKFPQHIVSTIRNEKNVIGTYNQGQQTYYSNLQGFQLIDKNLSTTNYKFC